MPPASENTPALSADDFKSILQDALTGLQGVRDEGVTALATQYAPRIAAIQTSDDPQGEFADIQTNLHLLADVLEVEAESVAFVAAGRAVQVALNVALKLAIAAA